MALLSFGGCTGHIDGDSAAVIDAPNTEQSTAPVDEPSAKGDLRTLTQATSVNAGLVRLRGLTREEYDNTVSAMLGERVSLTSKWGEEIGDSGGFATARAVSAKEVDEYLTAAEAVGARVKSSFSRLWDCSSESPGENACIVKFVNRLGRTAFRRPLLEAERASFVQLFETARTVHALPLEDSAALTAEAIAQSPSLVYHWELGPQRPLLGAAGKVALTAHEIAARLAYFLTQAPPDELLAVDADTGRVALPEVLRAHASRMLTGPASVNLFQRLVAKLLNLPADATAISGVDSALLESRQRFIEHTLGASHGSIQSLLLSTDYFINAQLAPLYGVSGIQGDELVMKAMNPAQRMGILTHVDYLKFTGKDQDSLPPRRGLKLLTEFLCEETPAVPAIPPTLQRKPGQTQREFFETEVEQQPCAKGCHAVIDPLGFAFEHYGGGAWRDTDQQSNKPINASGSATLPFGQSVPYTGASELIEAIANSEEYRQCMVRQAFRMATGRVEAGYDVDALKSALEAQRSAADNLRLALAEVIASESFRVRRLNAGELPQ